MAPRPNWSRWRCGSARPRKSSTTSPTQDQTTEIAAIRHLVDEAHRGAKEAITDLRDLARGIHPPALDTGLENALATLAARSSVPTEVTVAIETRPSPAIEAISYFCAAELLANVAQHAQASRAFLTCAQHGPWLRIVVRDNGQGGAAVNRNGSSSSGLAGLADRVGTVDGHLSIASPPGRPDRRYRRPALSVLTMASADAITVVIAEDSAILRDGLVQLLTDRGFAVTRAVGDAVSLERGGGRRSPRRGRGRYPHAADLYRRRAARRPRPAPEPSRRGDPGVLPIRRDPLRRRAAGRRRGRDRLPAQGQGRRRQPTSSKPWCGWRREAPPSTRRW